MSKIDYNSIVSLSQKEIASKVKTGELSIPDKGADRDEFQKFVAMSVEERKAMLNGSSGDGSGDTGASSTPPTPPAPEPRTGASTDEFFGYPSKEAMLEAHKQLIEKQTELRKEVDKLNASGGKLGRKNQDLESELEKIRKELEAERKAKASGQPPSGGTDLSIPEPPDPEKFSAGVFDDDYQKELAKFQKDLVKVQRSIIEKSRTLEGVVEGTVKKAETVEAEIQSKREKEEAEVKTAAWTKFWGEIRSYQGKNKQLNTTVDIEKINEAILANDRDTLASIPPADLEAFKKIRTLSASLADFSSGVPQLRYNSVDEMVSTNAAMWNSFMTGKPTPAPLTPAEERALIERKRQADANAVSSPNIPQGDPDQHLSEMADDVAINRLRELVAIRKVNPVKFDKGPFAEEFSKLRVRFGVASKKG